MTYLRFIPILALVFPISCTAMRHDSPSIKDLESTIRNARSPDEGVLRAIEELRKLPVQDIPPKLWSDVANDKACPDVHRRWAVLQLFDRYVLPNSTLGDVAALLASPTWLRADAIEYVTTLAGKIPVRMVPGDQVILIHIGLPSSDRSAVYLRISGKPSLSELYDTLAGENRTAANVVVREAGLYVEGESDKRIVK